MIRRTVALAVLALLVPAYADAANPRPKTIPALRTWNGGEGSYRLRHSIRIVMAKRDYRKLRSPVRIYARPAPAHAPLIT